jgi:hypothetical protein
VRGAPWGSCRWCPAALRAARRRLPGCAAAGAGYGAPRPLGRPPPALLPAPLGPLLAPSPPSLPARPPRRGSRKTLGNFVKATFAALAATYGFLTPDLWAETRFTKAPLQEFTDLLAKPQIAYKPAAAADY